MAYGVHRVNELLKKNGRRTDFAVLVVAAALIDRNNAILIQQCPRHKPLAGLWEFPGGKVEAGECCRAALCRELTEELGISVEPGSLEEFSFVTGVTNDGKPLTLLLYCCRVWRGELAAMDADALAWVPADQLTNYPLAPLDVPLAERLAKLIR